MRERFITGCDKGEVFKLLKWSTQHWELVKILTVTLAGHVIRAVNIAIVSALVEEGLFDKAAWNI